MKNNTEKNIINICKLGLNASKSLSVTKNSDRNKAIKLIAKKLIKNKAYILSQNKKDIEKAKKKNLSKHLLDRLLLDEKRISNMCKDIFNIAKLDDPLGKILSKTVRPNGLKISKVTVPLGLLAVILSLVLMLHLMWLRCLLNLEISNFKRRQRSKVHHR